MPEVLPFRGIRYAATRPATLSKLISPPYDAVSPAYRDELAARSPHNIIHVVLEKDRPGDDAVENRYVRSGRAFEAWLADGTLRQDAEPGFYLLEQGFTGPDGRRRVRRGLVVACRLHRYDEGVVLPHEKTLSGPKADRLEILKRVKANLSPIFALYEDERGEGQRALDAAIASAGEAAAEADSDDGTHHRIWRVVDPAAVAQLQAALAARKVFIADGHHRYESALVYRDLVDAEQPGLPDRAGHRYIMMTLCSMSDPGLVIYPTHRLLTGLKDFRLGRFLEELGRFFTVDTLLEDVRRPAGRAWAVSKLAEHAGKATTFLMVSAEDGRGRILTLRDDADMAGVPLPDNVTLRDLDVTALHSVLFQHLLGLSPRSQELGENVRYEMDAGEVVTRTLAGEFQLGFLVNPTPMWQVQAVAESGETMPQKSTFFYPKLASGLVLRKIHEELR
ncbi:DUF1015 domain-containing protein [Anaeromyxobacter diazotrophicus]|uniref:DUF1015 domain-containing protein n=1 Tax=Anaeromyxobacter diazotrophicus TaxID=2590199 RepID=A0A7I9VIZ8_9BACT|nr:DUF1015 domain-containing protein [Anaeromyxobacter diazotrophicus]GEJ56384.1 hypothetical protein AMYX_11250 [Anaeromyxobacter diazotrophicus]